LFYNASKPVTGASTSFKVAQQTLHVMSQLVSDLEITHVRNSPALDSKYLSLFK